MAIKFVSVKCPECGAALEVEEGREQIFCSYCGSKVIIENDNEYIYHHIDEAEIKQAETDRIIQLKKMEMTEKNRIAKEKRMSIKIRISIVLGIIAFIFLAIGFGGSNFGLETPGLLCGLALMMMWTVDKDDEELDFGDKVKVPSSISDFENKNYATIESMFSSAGFTNIKCVPLKDLTTGFLKKPGMVESITINGKEITSGRKKFSPDALVVISYHSFSNR